MASSFIRREKKKRIFFSSPQTPGSTRPYNRRKRRRRLLLLAPAGPDISLLLPFSAVRLPPPSSSLYYIGRRREREKSLLAQPLPPHHQITSQAAPRCSTRPPPFSYYVCSIYIYIKKYIYIKAHRPPPPPVLSLSLSSVDSFQKQPGHPVVIIRQTPRPHWLDHQVLMTIIRWFLFLPENLWDPISRPASCAPAWKCTFEFGNDVPGRVVAVRKTLPVSSYLKKHILFINELKDVNKKKKTDLDGLWAGWPSWQ